MGGGLLPVALHNSKLYFLLGRNIKNKKWSDFGGSKEKGETHYQSALREGVEELNGFLGHNMKSLVSKKKIMTITRKERIYKCILFTIDYNSMLPIYFNNHHKYVETHFKKVVDDTENGYYEKDKIQWFTIDEMKELLKKKKIRDFYETVLN